MFRRVCRATRGPLQTGQAFSSDASLGGSSPVVKMDTLVTLCKKRGFIYPSAEVYSASSGFFDYGPLGVEMKNNIKQLWWAEMVRGREVSKQIRLLTGEAERASRPFLCT